MNRMFFKVPRFRFNECLSVVSRKKNIWSTTPRVITGDLADCYFIGEDELVAYALHTKRRREYYVDLYRLEEEK